MNGICIIPECDNELKPGSKLDTCHVCRGSMGMWRRRGVRAILLRRSKLKKYDSRMETLVDRKGHDVAVLKQRKK